MVNLVYMTLKNHALVGGGGVGGGRVCVVFGFHFGHPFFFRLGCTDPTPPPQCTRNKPTSVVCLAPSFMCYVSLPPASTGGAPCVHARRFRFCCVSLWVGFRWSGSVTTTIPLLHVYYVRMFASILWLDFLFGRLVLCVRTPLPPLCPLVVHACSERCVHMPCATDAPVDGFHYFIAQGCCRAASVRV